MVEKVQLNVSLPERLNAQLRVCAEVDGLGLSQTVESALQDYIASRKADPAWQERHEAWVKKQRALLRAL